MIAGLDIGGTKCAVLLGEQLPDDLRVIERVEFPTLDTPDATIEQLKKTLSELCKKHGCTAPDAIGISCGGPLDSKRGVILSPPNLIGWDNIPIVQIMSDAFSSPAFLCNDADAGALAEWTFGAGRGCEHMVFMTFGTGLGAGLILNGKLYTGTANFAGEIGHVRLEKHGPVGYGKSGSAEGFCSGNGIAQLAKTRVLEQLQSGKTTVLAANTGDAAKITAKDVSIAATNGDELSLSIFAEVGEQFGRVLAVLADVLNPELVVAGGVYMRAHQFMDDAMWRAIRREALPGTAQALHVLPSLLGEKIGDYAALTVAVNGLKNA
jgi:glucokinase